MGGGLIGSQAARESFGTDAGRSLSTKEELEALAVNSDVVVGETLHLREPLIATAAAEASPAEDLHLRRRHHDLQLHVC